ncbi:MAG TPA: STAS domain-containing protein [Solirubrobacteraceae bacterium]|nr:STAS domain-containing protein [Solirubrobacteraceae bacterium]
MAAQEHLRVELRRESDRVVMALSGELDLASAPLFQRQLDRAEIHSAPMLVLDLEDLEFIDSTGLRIVLSARAGARERGQEFAVTPGSQQVQRLLNMTRVSEHLRIIEPPGEMLV